jgi:superfamily II DNA or RNA helicase
MIRSTIFQIPKLVRQSLIEASTIGKRNPFLRPSSQQLATNAFFRMSFSTAGAREEADEVAASLYPDPSTSSIKDRLPNWLRSYQVDVIEECIKALDRGVERIGVSSPTGSGKTVML